MTKLKTKDSLKPSGIFHNATSLLVIQIANQLLPLITIPHLTRALGVDAYGAYAYALALINIACVFTDFGFNLWATAEVSVHRNDRDRINRLYGEVTAAKIVLIVICMVIICAYATNSSLAYDYRKALYWTILPIVGMSLQPIWLFNGLEKMTYITISVLLARLVFTVLVFTLVNSTLDLDLLMGINGLSHIIAALLGCVILYRYRYIPVWSNWLGCWNVLKCASPFFLSRVAVSTYTAGGALFLGVVSTTRNVAMYAVAEQLYRGAQALLSPLGQVMYPYMIRTSNHRRLLQVTCLATIIACLGAAFTAYFGAYIIQLLFSAEYVTALPVLYVFMITIIINTPSILLGYPMLGALGRLHLANRSVLVAGVVQLLMFSAIYFYNGTTPVNVALAVLAAEMTVLILRSTWGGIEWHRRRISLIKSI